MAKSNGGIVQTAKQKQIAFSRIEFMFWFTLGTWSYFAPLLEASGMDSVMIGTVMALNSIMGIISPPIWGTLSDKIGSVKKIFLVLFGITVVCMVSLPTMSKITIGSFSMLTVMVPVATFFMIPMTALLDTWLVAIVGSEKTLDYGRIRLFGSIGFAVVGVINTLLVGATSTHIVFYTFGFFALPTMWFCSREPDMLAEEKTDAQEAELEAEGGLFSFYFITWLIFMFLALIGSNNSGTFLMYMILEVGGETSMVGAITGIRALMEVVFMIAGAKLMKKYSLKTLLMVGGCIYMLEQFLYQFTQSTLQVGAVALLNGLAYGLFLNCYIRYTAMMAPRGMEARAQTIVASMTQLNSVCVNFFGGIAVKYISIRLYYVICAGLIFFALLFFAGSLAFGNKVLKRPLPLGARKPLPENQQG